MKALIISDEENFIKTLNRFFQSHGADTIIYKWLLKALDNIEEIRPDVIVLSSSEYPRHWKTLVQFVKSGIGGDKVDIFLYEPNPVSDEDKEKIKLLGITGVFESLDDESLKVICPIFGEFISRVGEAAETEDVGVACDVAETEDVAEINEATETEDVETDSCDEAGAYEAAETEDTAEACDETEVCDALIFTHPLSKAFITGKIDSQNDNFIHFTADFDEQIKELKKGMISSATFYCGDDCTTVPVQINSIENEKIFLEVKV